MRIFDTRSAERARMAAAAIVLAASLAASGASAAPINIDFGAAFGTPSSSFGAAAITPGFWNQIDPTVSSPNAILDILGASPGVTLTISAGEGLFSNNDPSTTGDVQALLDDELDVLPSTLGGSATITVSGLVAGEHIVYTYARDADAPSSETVTITVNGIGASVGATSNTFTGFIEGETHAVHVVTLLPGQDLVITSTIENDDGADYGMINGIQITPEPNTYVMVSLGLVGLAVCGRRRPEQR
jgi:hypothetical protein